MELQQERQEKVLYNNFLESPAGKNLISDLKRKIRQDLDSILELAEPNTKLDNFYPLASRLKANLNVYKIHKGVKTELIALEESLGVEEEESED